MNLRFDDGECDVTYNPGQVDGAAMVAAVEGIKGKSFKAHVVE